MLFRANTHNTHNTHTHKQWNQKIYGIQLFLFGSGHCRSAYFRTKASANSCYICSFLFDDIYSHAHISCAGLGSSGHMRGIRPFLDQRDSFSPRRRYSTNQNWRMAAYFVTPYIPCFFFFLVRCAAQHSFIHSFGVCCVAQHSVYCLYASNGVCFVFSVYIVHLPAVAGSTTPLNKIHSECVVMVHRCRCEASKQAKKMAKPKIPPCLLLTHTQYAAQPSATKQRDS